MNDENLPPVEPSGALIQALVRILCPLVRLMIRRQVAYPFVSQLLKSVYLKEAIAASEKEEKRLTDSRLSMITGVHRKDVRRLRQQDEGVMLPESRPASVAAQVFSIWMSEYVDAQGEPLPLYKLTAKGTPSFEKLVTDISRHDIRARSLLDEWLEKKLVVLDTQGRVHLNKDAFLPGDDFDSRMHFFGQHVEDHIAACVENISGHKPAFFERGVYFNNLSPQSEEELKQLIDQEAMALLKKINSKGRELQLRDRGNARHNRRFRFGAYFYTDKNYPNSKRKR